MTQRYIKIGATVLVLGLAFAGLFWSTLRDGTEYYKNLDAVMTNESEWHGKHLHLPPYAVPESISRSKNNSLEYRFTVQYKPARVTEPGSAIDVWYTGIARDTFEG